MAAGYTESTANPKRRRSWKWAVAILLLAVLACVLVFLIIHRSSPELVEYETIPIGPNWEHVRLLVPAGWEHRMTISFPDALDGTRIEPGTMIMPKDSNVPKWLPRSILRFFRIRTDDGCVSVILVPPHANATRRPMSTRVNSRRDRGGKMTWVAVSRGNLVETDLTAICTYITDDRSAFERNYRRIAASLKLVRY